jgi:hypothetical protein
MKLLVMVNDANLQFIREKICVLQNAVMYNSSDGLVKLGNDIITATKVDEEGLLWFVTNRPAQVISQCEQSFPARLRFYRKGIGFYLEISGKATIVSSDYSFSDMGPGNKKGNAKKVLIKLEMKNIEYTEPHAKRPKGKIEIIVENWYSWFLRTISVQHDSSSVLKKLRQTN